MGISDRQMRRWRERYEEHGYDGLIDRRRGRPSERRVPVAMVEQVLGLYREKYFDLNVRHFHEKLSAEHGIELIRFLALGFSTGVSAMLLSARSLDSSGRLSLCGKNPFAPCIGPLECEINGWFAGGWCDDELRN
jgi:hypothetical protein